jgi:hypothetical protein
LTDDDDDDDGHDEDALLLLPCGQYVACISPAWRFSLLDNGRAVMSQHMLNTLRSTQEAVRVCGRSQVRILMPENLWFLPRRARCVSKAQALDRPAISLQEAPYAGMQL